MLTQIRSYMRSFVDDFHAHRRGEVRVAPRGQTGRVYAKVAPSPSSVAQVTAQPVATLTMQITRANGQVETITVPATLKVLPNG